jgi:hypothetical protein
MKTLLFFLTVHFCLASALPVAAQSPAHIVCLTVEEPNNYDSVNACRGFAEKEWKALGHRVTIIEGNLELPTHFEGFVEAMKSADLLVAFVRRATPAARAARCDPRPPRRWETAPGYSHREPRLHSTGEPTRDRSVPRVLAGVRARGARLRQHRL